MTLADLKSNYLFETRPDIFPEGYLTVTEIDLWGIYYNQKRLREKACRT